LAVTGNLQEKLGLSEHPKIRKEDNPFNGEGFTPELHHIGAFLWLKENITLKLLKGISLTLSSRFDRPKFYKRDVGQAFLSSVFTGGKRENEKEILYIQASISNNFPLQAVSFYK
jgi:hypothetical protein